MLLIPEKERPKSIFAHPLLYFAHPLLYFAHPKLELIRLPRKQLWPHNWLTMVVPAQILLAFWCCQQDDTHSKFNMFCKQLYNPEGTYFNDPILSDFAVICIVENYYSRETVEQKVMFTLSNDEVSKKLSNCHKVWTWVLLNTLLQFHRFFLTLSIFVVFYNMTLWEKLF